MPALPPPEVAVTGDLGPQTPLVVLLHGRGSHEKEIIGLADRLPAGATYAAVRGPIAEGGGFAWFANRGIGRPRPDSLRTTMDWFRTWLGTVATDGRPVILAGFSGGAAFAGGLLLDNPSAYAGTAILYGTLPFDAGVPVTPGHLAGAPVFLAHGSNDTVIPAQLQARTWSYLHDESGATLTARRDPVGHGLAPLALDALRAWLTTRIA
jgi:phospholipase/carboxylesterase